MKLKVLLIFVFIALTGCFFGQTNSVVPISSVSDNLPVIENQESSTNDIISQKSFIDGVTGASGVNYFSHLSFSLEETMAYIEGHNVPMAVSTVRPDGGPHVAFFSPISVGTDLLIVNMLDNQTKLNLYENPYAVGLLYTHTSYGGGNYFGSRLFLRYINDLYEQQQLLEQYENSNTFNEIFDGEKVFFRVIRILPLG
jgi:hypothetical protein